LFAASVGRCAERGFRPYLLGARQDVLDRAVAALKAKHPTLELAGWRNGYWRTEEEAAVVAEIRRTRPDVMFVGMSSPKKEVFVQRWKAELQVPFIMGVGGTFDVVAGIVKRAPVWMQRAGLEWLYRLAQEPRRMWRRYLVEDTAFFALLAREWWRQRRRQ